MPTISLHRRLLNEINEINESSKRARLDLKIQELTYEILQNTDIGSDMPSNGTSISSLSSLTSDTDTDSTDNLDLSDMEFQLREDLQHELNGLRHEILTTCVLEPGHPIKKSQQLHLLDDFGTNNLCLFCKKLRVDPSTFHTLLAMIEDHPIFYNNSNIPQAPPNVQLAIFLNRIGHYGNSASPEDLAQWAGGSTGWIEKCTNRVMVAVLALHDVGIHLPTADEKEDAKAWVEGETCPEWRDGFLLVDGTKFPVFQRPGLHGDAWFDKNKDYSLDCQVCSTFTHRIFFTYQHDSWSCFRTHLSSPITLLVTLAAFMTLGRSRVLAHSRNTTPYSLLESGCGLIQPTHLRHGVSPHTRSLLGLDLHQIKEHTTTMSPRYGCHWAFMKHHHTDSN